MKSNKRSLKAIALSLGLAALMAPATMDAQINHGLLQNPYKDNSGKNHGMMNSTNNRGQITIPSEGITNYGIGESSDAPLGSGLFILLGAGLGYAALKKKEDEQ